VSTRSRTTERPRTGERARPATRARRDTRPFLERHRGALVGAVIVAVVVVVSGLVFLQATQPAYACSEIYDPPAAASPSGAPQPDRGKTHVNPGTFLTYDFCPPASGPHNTTSQFGPIAARYYGPDEQTVPQGWVHNLEHGALVVLYKCTGSVCDDSTQQQLRQFASTFPPSPVCGVKAGVVSPVVTRFEQLPHPFAAIVWDRVAYFDSWDPQQVLDFYAKYGEQVNPEPQCARATPTAAPSASAGASATASPTAAASASPS
jgi:hypothetical protein